MTSPDTTPVLRTVSPGDLPGALCPQTDPELFFPEIGASPQAAKKVCATCEVRPDCLALALSLGAVMGVWGGTTENERRDLKRAARATGLQQICRGCEEPFTATAPNAVYCGDLCRQKARRATKAASDARRTRTSSRRAA
ncbi:hypothetical protein J2S40_001654 [Nocardioides luteus]|uniref:Transcriptional regulator WhiB n=1 Tax=Nocardioides luteus TaxID=1844 RepID=A0ABQ5T060_9ACTN|nr:hypothetical protein [Nocardioides luteus]GGR41851.1 hypothetical protein GCM10010197_04000 [Nocardioides luteus]GLJ69624.1 hypothetical protein GCM10017579_36600 [Nocardioides luteus]